MIQAHTRPFSSCSDLSSLDLHNKSPVPCKDSMHHNWTLMDAVTVDKPSTIPKLSMTAFNHLSREVLNLENSKRFYVDILGFEVIPRPPFDCEGYWLHGHGLNLHLITTTVPKERQRVKAARIQHFSSALPRVDHFAFLTSDINAVRAVLDHHQVYYKYDAPQGTGIHQIFLFDPDGNVIEISNCVPVMGRTTCDNPDLIL